jgi:hypothetical protein
VFKTMPHNVKAFLKMPREAVQTLSQGETALMPEDLLSTWEFTCQCEFSDLDAMHFVPSIIAISKMPNCKVMQYQAFFL